MAQTQSPNQGQPNSASSANPGRSGLTVKLPARPGTGQPVTPSRKRQQIRVMMLPDAESRSKAQRENAELNATIEALNQTDKGRENVSDIPCLNAESDHNTISNVDEYNAAVKRLEDKSARDASATLYPPCFH
ncbi:hypothetical protein B0H19DRAFT_1069887 [Mycena capillaripes]|nr:hypothetical protein B0H19DRAFT_1069887 [Mycena capillaripes]